MKGIFYDYRESALELKKISTLTVTGMLIAVAVVLRNLSIYITEDIRISFAFIGTMAIAMLFGPSAAMLGAAGIDVIGYFLDGKVARDYNIWLLLVKVAAAAVYGVLLYRRASGKSFPVRVIIARAIGILVFQMILNSCILYDCYTNPHFPIMTKPEWDAFFIWFSPRIVKNLLMLPIECILSAFLLPLIYKAYRRVFVRNAAGND